MTLDSYLTRLESTLRSRRDFEIEQMSSDAFFTGALFRARLRFYDNSALVIVSARINRIVHICVVIVSANCPKFEGNGTEIARIPSGNGEFTQPIPTVWPKR